MCYYTYMNTAIFAAGCFWGVQFYFDQVPGVLETVVGYTGGHVPNPSYDAVCTEKTGHAESVEIMFDPKKVDYETLVRQFFRMHNPTERNRQGPDVGDQYRSAIFYRDDSQKVVAERVRDSIAAQYDEPIATEITKAGAFYDAEPYHQKFSQRTGIGMCHIPYAPLAS